jgi:hypothetical protein
MMNDKTTKLVVQLRRHCAEEPPLGVLVLLLLQVGRGGPVAPESRPSSTVCCYVSHALAHCVAPPKALTASRRACSPSSKKAPPCADPGPRGQSSGNSRPPRRLLLASHTIQPYTRTAAVTASRPCARLAASSPCALARVRKAGRSCGWPHVAPAWAPAGPRCTGTRTQCGRVYVSLTARTCMSSSVTGPGAGRWASGPAPPAEPPAQQRRDLSARTASLHARATPPSAARTAARRARPCATLRKLGQLGRGTRAQLSRQQSKKASPRSAGGVASRPSKRCEAEPGVEARGTPALAGSGGERRAGAGGGAGVEATDGPEPCGTRPRRTAAWTAIGRPGRMGASKQEHCG